MIAYHGGPITPVDVARQLWTRRHAMVSFETPDQLPVAAECAQSFTLDNGAFSAWKRGAAVDWDGYVDWVCDWMRHPGFGWCVIPDVIDGSEAENDGLVEQWRDLGLSSQGVPVWHLHESIDRLVRLADQWPRVALGSSGAFADPGSGPWWQRIGLAMDELCDDMGRPACKLHGLRMLDPTIFSQLPLRRRIPPTSPATSGSIRRGTVRRTRRGQRRCAR